MSKKNGKKKARNPAKKINVEKLLKRIETLERRVNITRERVDKGPGQNDWQGW